MDLERDAPSGGLLEAQPLGLDLGVEVASYALDRLVGALHRAIVGVAFRGTSISARGDIPGSGGWVDDDLAFVKPWGFDIAEIEVPVEVRYGARDVLVPAAHGAWLGGKVPGAVVVVEESEGHLGDPDQVTEGMRCLVTGE